MSNVIQLIKREANRKTGWTMRAKDKVGELFLYDSIGGGFWEEGTTAKSFQRDLKNLGDIETLNVFINSPGGSVFEGVAIFNQLDRFQARKVVQVDGLAASIASVIMLAGDERTIAANGLVMIHDPWSIAFGSADDMRKMADSLDKVRSAILDTYVDRTGSAEGDLSAMMTEETWMTAEEALDAGFVDSIGAEIEMAAHFDLSEYKRPPAALVEAMKADPEPDPPPADPPADPEPEPAIEPAPELLDSRARAARHGLGKRRTEPAPTAA